MAVIRVLFWCLAIGINLTSVLEAEVRGLRVEGFSGLGGVFRVEVGVQGLQVQRIRTEGLPGGAEHETPKP